MGNENYFVVLGAPDPEMNNTELLLKIHDIPYQHAMINGWRCHAGNAYRADPIRVPKGKRLVLVECEPVNYLDFPDLVRVDHHRPGIDPAAELGPGRYLEASSIGQVCKLLSENVTNEVRVIAAHDHCFSSAVQGLCPRIHPSDVVAFRINEIRSSYSLSKNQINVLLDKFFRVIKSAKTKKLDKQEVLDLRRRFCFNHGYTKELLILQTVLAKEGKAALIHFSHYEGGAQRVVLTGYAYPETVQAFMIWAKEKGHVEIFGVPERNYAGAIYPI